MAAKKEALADVAVAEAIIEQAPVVEAVAEKPKSDAPIDTLAPYKERETVDHKCFVISGPTQRI